VWLQELTLLQGKQTSEFAALLGYATDGELIHRGNLALLLAGEAVITHHLTHSGLNLDCWTFD
jgi:hypothetical protein